MLDSIITSKTRIKLLLKFFLNSETKSYLRNLEQEFGESTNAIRLELNRLEGAGLLNSEVTGNRKYFKANTNHPLFNDINNILKKFVGIDKLIEKVINQIGSLEKAYITGDFAEGRNSQIVDLVLVGRNIDTSFIEKLISKSEELIDRKIRYLILSEEQMEDYFKNKASLLIWESDGSIGKTE
ncbi:MAG: ArsR family transcriptional regulator [Prolixibacteraceae bacterium]|nr:ArsR family transcriptional regulator [Prolixibacteraceae bacterium]